jgi:hypothetical protein
VHHSGRATGAARVVTAVLAVSGLRVCQASRVSSEDDGLWPYYALDFPGLSQTDAERILAWVNQQGANFESLTSGPDAVAGSVLEPQHWYVRFMDRCTVTTLKTASEAAIRSGQLTRHEADVLASMVEDFIEWLDQAEDDVEHDVDEAHTREEQEVNSTNPVENEAEGEGAETDPLVFLMRDVFLGRPILSVYHESDGDWQYLTDGDATRENAQLVHQSHVYKLDPSIRELHSMPLGTWATRAAPGEPWSFGMDDD